MKDGEVGCNLVVRRRRKMSTRSEIGDNSCEGNWWSIDASDALSLYPQEKSQS